MLGSRVVSNIATPSLDPIPAYKNKIKNQEKYKKVQVYFVKCPSNLTVHWSK